MMLNLSTVIVPYRKGLINNTTHHDMIDRR